MAKGNGKRSYLQYEIFAGNPDDEGSMPSRLGGQRLKPATCCGRGGFEGIRDADEAEPMGQALCGMGT